MKQPQILSYLLFLMVLLSTTLLLIHLIADPATHSSEDILSKSVVYSQDQTVISTMGSTSVSNMEASVASAW